MKCPSCDHGNPIDARFCMRCGTRLAVVCPACERELPADAVFCGYCGSSITVDDAAASVPSFQQVAPAPQPVSDAVPEQPESFAGGRYLVRRFLGEGGKKRVYLTHDTLLDRDVAFSLIKTQGLDETGVERIKREAQLMGRLGDHPYIVALYDIGEEAGQPFLVSQLMGGGDVEGLIEDAPDHRPPLEVSLRIADQMCQALEYAHSHGIIHRDLKPGNVWLTADGTAKLGDFGLAIAMDRSRLSVAGMIVGTIGYLPPEQAMGRQPDGRSDLYSLGAMLYELVTGRPPFLGDDPVAIISQHLNTQPVAPSWHSPDVPKALETLILRLLAKNPDERPQTASAVREELQAIQTSVSQAQPEPSREPSTSEIRNPLDRLAGGVFVGRESELEQLRRAVDAVMGGAGQIVLLVGEPGIGKTTLAEELATYARLRGAQVLWSRNYEWEGTPAYWAWVQLIRDYAHSRDPQALRSELGAGGGMIAQVVSEVREVVPDLPDAPALEGDGARFRLFDALATFLRNASRNQPLVLVIDDLHWADAPSLLLLQYLARELRDARVLLVGTYRDMEVGRHHPLAGTLAELAREQRLQRVTLRGLSRGDVARYLELTAGKPPTTELVDAILGQTEGNPFFVAEVVRLLVSEGNLEREGGESWSVSLPQGVREVVGRRLDRLAPECNELLSAAAVIGREFDLRLLAAVVEQPADQVLEALEEALAARVIREGDAVDTYRFQQELIQETLYEELSIAQRRRLNSKVARAMEEIYADDLIPHYTQLAHHYAAAGPGEDAEKAAEYAVRAGDRAMTQAAWETAVGLYEQALQSLDTMPQPDDVERCQLLLKLGEAESAASGLSAAQESFVQAAELAREIDRPELLAQAALGAAGKGILTGQDDEVVRTLLEQAVAALGSGDSALRAACFARLSLAIVAAGNETVSVRRDRLTEDAVAMARRLGDPALLALALHARHSCLRSQGDINEQLHAATEAVDFAEQAGDLELLVTTYCWRLFEPLLLGDRETVDKYIEELTRLDQQLAQPFYSFTITGIRAMHAFIDGRFDDGAELTQRAQELAHRTDAPFAEIWWWLLTFYRLREQGPIEDLDSIVHDLIQRLADDIQAVAIVRSQCALILAEEGRDGDARSMFAAIEASTWRDATRVGHPFAVACLAEASTRLGATERARELRDQLLPFAERCATFGGAFMFAGSNAYYLGLLATVLSRWDEAERRFEDALAMNEKMRAMPFIARTQYAYADMLVKSEDAEARDKALELVDSALATAEALEMRRLAREALALKVQIQGILKA